MREGDDPAQMRLAAEDDEVGCVVGVEGDAAAGRPVDAAVDEVAAGSEQVLDVGADRSPALLPPARELAVLVEVTPNSKTADTVGVGDS